MKISLAWLADYVSVPPVDELARRLTMAGLEVEGIDRPGAALAGVVVAQIVDSQPHPNADKLSVTKIDAGGAQQIQVVCGAKNYKVGDKVPLATVGTTLPGGLTIKAAQLRGVDSAGMLCSAKELAMAEASDGLLILDPALQVGTPIAVALGVDDVVLEVNVTPNRADALSHLGIAREVATLFSTPLKLPATQVIESEAKASEAVSVRIDDGDRCWRYSARVIEGVAVKPSPEWLQRRLKAVGVRAINNLVDATNYVMFEYGQPLHAFDLDSISGGQIVVRAAKAGETLVTLDQKSRALHADDLLIADAEKALVIAGVMGGASSEVSTKTTRVLLECATFQPATVRRSSKRHALHTESSHRFERGTDVANVPAVLDRAAALIVQLAGGTVRAGQVSAVGREVKQTEVGLRTSAIGELLGLDVDGAEAHSILKSLGFRLVSGDTQTAHFAVPHARVDVSIENDLIEEIARVKGFENIPTRLPRGLHELKAEPTAQRVERVIRQALAGSSFDEVINYSFLSGRELEAFGALAGSIRIANPLSEEQGVMRTTLYPSLVGNVVRAWRHQAAGVRFYEWARTYQADSGGGEGLRPVARETQQVAGILWGLRDGARTWTEKETRVDYYDARAAVESVAQSLHVGGVSFGSLKSDWYHPRASAAVLLNGKQIGSLGELHPVVARKLGAPEGIFMFQLEVAPLQKASVELPQATPLSKYPSVLRDLAVVVPLSMQSEAVRAVILEVGKPLVTAVDVFDAYSGEHMEAGRKNLAFALEYKNPEKTLTDAEVNDAHQKIIAQVTARLGAEFRS